jgi:hypothetical protein
MRCDSLNTEFDRLYPPNKGVRAQAPERRTHNKTPVSWTTAPHQRRRPMRAVQRGNFVMPATTLSRPTSAEPSARGCWEAERSFGTVTAAGARFTCGTKSLPPRGERSGCQRVRPEEAGPMTGLRVSGEGQGRHSQAASRPPHPGLLLAHGEKEDQRRRGRARRTRAPAWSIAPRKCGIWRNF